MAQVPLVIGGAAVPPNLVFTFDDSGSMFFECLPESLCIGSKYVGSMPGGFDTFKNGVATYDINSLFNRQMRSSSTNVTYYNPTVRYSPWLKSDGTNYPTYPATAAPIDPRSATTVTNLVATATFTTSFCTGPSNCANGSQSIYPAQYFTLTSGTGTALTNFTRTMIVGALSTYPKTVNRTDCLLLVCSLAEEQQNFANWFTYYRNKLISAIGGTASAFYTLPVSYRLGYGRINQSGNVSIDGVNSNTLVRGLRPFTGTDRDAFYTWLFSLQPDPGGTPLRRALGDVGEYYSRSDNAGPWGNIPGTSDTTAHLTCRRSYHLLMTDGSWNGAGASNAAAGGNVDNTNGTVITGPNGQSYTYNRAYPYRDAYSDTLADVAMYYWRKDLRSDLANDVKPTAGDLAFWQHMVNYTIGFGVNGNLVNPDDLPALTAGTKTWGDPSSDANNKVDDLWHAAVNSRGLSLSAADPQEYAAALRAVITNIDERTGSEAGIGLSGRFLVSGSKKYVPEYRTGAWTGEVRAVLLDSDGDDGATAWTASDHLPAPAARNIYTFKDTTVKGVTFTWAGLTAQGMTSTLNVTAAEGPNLVNYLRGDATNEGGIYRSRAKKLGDIVNSSPSLVKDLVDMGYIFLPNSGATVTPRATYREFLRNKKFRVPQLFVGANDGMLHAFSDVNGTETFAFMPRSVLGIVKNLGNVPYDHQYFVDGPTTESDVYDTGAAAWRNVVYGSGGGGAKNLFAINVPVPSSPTGSATLTVTLMPPGPSDILWEVNNTQTDFLELGYLLQSPEVGITLDGQWVAIFGNGYESLSGKAQLFIVNALTGALIKRIDTGVPTLGGGNGLSGVKVVRDAQARIVGVYGGDLKGNLWKFDLSGTTVASWGVAFGSTALAPKPLFTSINRNGQASPFTARPETMPHPLGGVMVLAGTGKLFEASDTSNLQERTLYGLWDKVPVGSDSSATSGVINGTATLVMQQVSLTVSISVGTPAQTVTYYTGTQNTVDYATKRGWYFPQTVKPGERLTYDPVFVDDVIEFKTIVPGASVATCQASSGEGIRILLNPLTGAPNRALVDTNGDGVIDSNDRSDIIGFQGQADGGDGVITKGTTTPGGAPGAPGGDGGNQTCAIGAGGKLCIPTAGTSVRRSWRQLFNPPAVGS